MLVRVQKVAEIDIEAELEDEPVAPIHPNESHKPPVRTTEVLDDAFSNNGNAKIETS
jgi:hypothetical protein